MCLKMKKVELKFGDKVLVKTGKRKIEEGFVWKAGKRDILVVLEGGRYVITTIKERKLLWKLPSDKWLWEEL